MNKKLIFKLLKFKILIVFTMFFNVVLAQSPDFSIKWESNVGCVNYDDIKDGKEREYPGGEGIADSDCHQICENTSQVYYFTETNFQSANWNVVGGSISSGQGTNSVIINWSNRGDGKITLSVVNADGGYSTYEQCVKIIANPVARFIINGNEENKTFCFKSDLFFNNLSEVNGGSQLYSYHWDFGDNTFSNLFEPTKNYEEFGTYTVILTVKNECQCIAEYSFEIEITKEEAKPIVCPTVVCEGQVAYYSTDDECPKWSVIGGEIVRDHGRSIEVLWNDVDDYGFGYVTYDSECGCQSPVTVKVPVVKSKINIEGPAEICLGDTFTYKIPQWPTTEVRWTLSNTNGGLLQQTEQRNEINFTALQPGTYTLKAEYKNTLLGCTGSGEIKISVKDKLIISGTDKVCQYSGQIFNSNAGSSTLWQLYKNTTLVTQQNGQNFIYSFSTPGLYRLEATAPNFCPAAPIFITVVDRPDTPVGIIDGETLVCPTINYEYSFVNTDPNSEIEWDVMNGNIVGSNIGESVIVDFNDNATTFAIKIRRVSKDPLKCTSEYFVLNVLKDTVTPIITHPTSSHNFCSATQTTFSTNLVAGGNVESFTWEFYPPELGNIINGANDNSNITVNFNTPTSSNLTSGYLIIKYFKCGEEFEHQYSVNVDRVPQISLAPLPPNICSGYTLPLVFNYLDNTPLVSADVSITVGAQTYNATVQNGQIVVPNIIPVNNSGEVQDQTVNVVISNINGCTSELRFSQTITVLPNVNIRISPARLLYVCSDVTNWTKTFDINYTGGGTIKFYKINGSSSTLITDYSVSGNSLTVGSSYTNGFGSYYAEVTSVHGCVYRSDTLIVSQVGCSTATPCDVPDPFVSSSITNLCNEITISNVFSNTVSLIRVDYDSHNTNLQAGYNVNQLVFTTDIPGTYIVRLYYRYLGCDYYKEYTFTKHFEPDFSFNISCEPRAGRNGHVFPVTLTDHSVYYTQPTTLSYSVNGGSYVTAGVNHTLNLLAGNHTITQRLQTTVNGVVYTCEKTKTITVYPVPDATFTFSATEACYDQAIQFTPNFQDPLYKYEWSYNQRKNHIMAPLLQLGEDYAVVTLTVTSPNNCSRSYTVYDFRIYNPEFLGEISGEGTYCKGDAAQLAYIPLNTQSISGYQWLFNGQPIANANQSTYTATQTGRYSIAAYDNFGCYKVSNAIPVNLTFTPKPIIRVNGANSVCLHSPYNFMYSVANIAGQQIRIFKDGILFQDWTNIDPTNLPVISDTPSQPGTYTYTFEVRITNNPNCIGSFEKVLEVNPLPEIHHLSFNFLTCEPSYLVELSVDGAYYDRVLWSNGQSGETITVTEGGAYQVTLVNSQGCSVSQSIYVPKDPNMYTWVFPNGCYSLCKENDKYLIGPSPNVYFYPSIWRNEEAGNFQQTYGQTPNYSLIGAAGENTLTLNNSFCKVETKPLHINEIDCKDCKFDGKFEIIKCINDKYTGITNYQLYLDFSNYFGMPINITLTSNQGYFVPSTIFVDSGDTISTDQIYFYPYQQTNYFNYVISMADIYGKEFQCSEDRAFNNLEDLCKKLVRFTKKSTDYLKVAPNPTNGDTTLYVDYELEDSSEYSIHVYTMLGIEVFSTKVTNQALSQLLPSSQFNSGTYLIILKKDQVPVNKTSLIKN